MRGYRVGMGTAVVVDHHGLFGRTLGLVADTTYTLTDGDGED